MSGKEVDLGLSGERENLLREAGFELWGESLEASIRQRIFPEISLSEGRAIAERFSDSGIDLRKFQSAELKGTVEESVMETIRKDLESVFGKEIGAKVESFVGEVMVPLRGTEVKSTKFLKMATENVLRDILAVAELFQKEGTSVSTEARSSLSNLAFSCFTRLTKGVARKEGFCSKESHKHHSWHVRGLRDLPPRSLKVIGSFIDDLLEQKAS